MKSNQAMLSAFIAASLISTPDAASAAAGEASRAGAAVEGEQLAGGMGPAWLVAAILAVLAGVIVVTDDDDEQPVSP